MKLSVLIPVYNVADCIAECLHSVMDEADAEVEVICVDDGSTDGSGEMLDEFASHERPNACGFKVVHQRNAGAGAARNAALELATGEWILFLDADDRLAKGWHEVLRTMAVRHASAQMLGFGRTETQPFNPVHFAESREADVSHVVGFDVYSRGLWQFAYRRETIDGLRFERIVLVEDKLFQGAAILRSTRIALTDAPVYCYRQREGSIVHSAWTREKFEAELVWRVKWLKAMTAAGRTMDRRLWRYMGLSFLEYIPFFLTEIKDPALKTEMEDRWFDVLSEACAYPFSAWQRFAMRILGTTRSRFAAGLFCRLPVMVKHALGRHHPEAPRRRLLFCGVGFGHGGLARSFPRIAEILEKKGYDVKVLVPHACEMGKLDLPPGYEVGPAFRWKASLWTGRALRLFHLITGGVFRFVAARRIPHDAFVVYGASCAVEWCGYSRKPVWGFLHSVPYMGSFGFLRPWLLRDTRKSASKYSGIFAVSNAMRDSWKEIGIDSETLRLPRDGEVAASASGTIRDALQCVCVGRLSWEKGQDMLLQAFARTPGLSLVLVGDGPMRKDLEELSRTLGIGDRVEFVGWQEEPSSFLARAGLFVNSSRSEGLCISIIEALCEGTPVLATDVPGNREALSGGRFGHLVPATVDGLAAGLAAYAADHGFCDPEIGFEGVRNDLRALSDASEERLAKINWTEPT